VTEPGAIVAVKQETSRRGFVSCGPRSHKGATRLRHFDMDRLQRHR
jgi:hypothetical protein